MPVRDVFRSLTAAVVCGAGLSGPPTPVLAFSAAEPALAQLDATGHVVSISCEWDACGWAWGPAAVINGIIAGSDIGRHAVATSSPYLSYPAYYSVQPADEQRSQFGCERRPVGPHSRARSHRSCLKP